MSSEARRETPLTREDVNELLANPSVDTRAGLAGKVASQMEASELTDDSRRLAEDIIRVMAQDASSIVREALANNLKTSQHLPHDVAVALARDIDTVALPVLEFSSVLSDNDLVAILDQSSAGKQTAVARRAGLSDEVATALVEKDNPEVIRELVANESAQLSESTLNLVVDRYGEDESVHTPLVKRSKLPLTVAEKLVVKVSDALKDYLVTHHELSADTATELVMQARERATVNLVGNETDMESLEELILQLHKSGRLTPSLVLRAICMGDMRFTELAFATLADVPLQNARMLLHDAGSLGLRSLYRKAGLPEGLLTVMRAALDVALSTDVRGADYDRESFSRTVLERVLSVCEDLRQEDADYLLHKLDDLAPAALHAAQ